MPMLVERSITKPATKKNCSNQGAMSLPRPSPSALTKSRLASGNPLAPMVEKTSTQRATSKRAPINQKVMRCSVFATFHHALKRRSFSSVEGGTYPSDGAATSSPVMGETMLGMWMPMPIHLYRTKKNWQRMLDQHAP